MKVYPPQKNKFFGIAGVASIALALPSLAIERPADAPKEKEPAAEEVGQDVKKPEKKMAMLGLGGSPVSQTLSMHLGLEEGAGLTLFHIVPDSAAEKAGLKPHDVVTSFNGVPIGSQDELREQIFKHKPGDEVTIKFFHKGNAQEKKIILGERPEHMHAGRGGAGINPRWMFKGLGGEIPEAERKRMEEQVKQQIERLQKQFKKDGVMELNFEGLGNAKPQKGKGGFQMNAASSISISDEQGMITIKTADGKKEVVVKDKEGEVLFEGPYDTPQDKAGVPDDIRDRLEKLNIGKNGINGMQLRIMPGLKGQPPIPNEDEDAQ